jgi:hypothetical protein
MPQFGMLMMLTIMPLQMLSGGTTPRESMPEFVQNIMLIAPTTHFVELSQAILYRGAGLEWCGSPFWRWPDRHGAVCPVAGALSQNHRPDGLMNRWPYAVDAWQRSILYADVRRQRGNQYLMDRICRSRRRTYCPTSLLTRSIMSGLDSDFRGQSNYGLVPRILPPAELRRCDPRRKRTVRALHRGRSARRPRPGIGGFKPDSEVGAALKAGHPCYFVGFLPDPVPGQTVEDVMRAEAAFVRKVGELHPAGDRQALRHRQLPGRLADADDSSRVARTVRTDHRRRRAAVLLGRKESDALRRRPARRQLADRH